MKAKVSRCEERMMLRIILFAFLVTCSIGVTEGKSFAFMNNDDAEFAKMHLYVDFPYGWKKGKINTILFMDCIPYANEEEGMVLMACPVVGKKHFHDHIKDEKNSKDAHVIGNAIVKRRDKGKTVFVSAPLKKGEGGAFFVITGDFDDDVFCCKDKDRVLITQNGVQMLAIDPKLLQRAEPMLRAFRDFDIPEKMPIFPPIVIGDQEDLTEKYAAKRNWKLELPPGWIEMAPLMKASCLDGGYALTYADYILPEHMRLQITICPSQKSAEEIARYFYYTMKKGFPRSDESCGAPVEKNGSWTLEALGGKFGRIQYITSSNGLYSEIVMETLNDHSFDPGRELLGRLRPDDPALFPRGYE